MRLLATRLKSRHDALEQLTMWAAVKGIGSDTTAEALLHWLDPTCHVCNGLGVRHVEHQASRTCNKCHGVGEKDRPDGAMRVLRQIEYALDVARGKLRKRLKKPTNGY
jgi:DnaJ-class molecular chaperone